MSRDLPADMGGGSTAMVLCQKQLHQSSSSMELGLGLSYRREGRVVMALGICTEGEHIGKVQLTILSQSKVVITNLDKEEDKLNSARVTAMLGQMSGIVAADEQDLVKGVLESPAKGVDYPCRACRSTRCRSRSGLTLTTWQRL